MRMLVNVLSNPSTSKPTDCSVPLPVMFTSFTSASDEPLFAPCFTCSPTTACLMLTPLTLVSLPLSMDTPLATLLPSMIPPEST